MPTKCYRAKIILYLPSSEAEILYSAIRPEVKDIPSRRTSVSLRVLEGGGGLELEITASDPTALRAALNSFLRFIDSILETFKVIDMMEK